MIESSTARPLVEQLRRVEERLSRLLISGWRQAGVEAAELQHEADALSEAGLTEVAARIGEVARANDAAEALRAIALASSACRLLRIRLLADEVPDGWAPLAPSRPTASSTGDVVLPIARLILDGREVWACARPTRGQWLLLEPPFPVDQPESLPRRRPRPAGSLACCVDR